MQPQVVQSVSQGGPVAPQGVTKRAQGTPKKPQSTALARQANSKEAYIHKKLPINRTSGHYVTFTTVNVLLTWLMFTAIHALLDLETEPGSLHKCPGGGGYLEGGNQFFEDLLQMCDFGFNLQARATSWPQCEPCFLA